MDQAKGRCGNRPEGFTILEIIVVLGLISILTAFAVPLINADRFRMDSAALEVSTTLHSVQRNGVLQGNNVNISFDTAGRRLMLHVDTDNDGIHQPTEDFRVVDLEEGVAFGLGGAPARPRGNTDVSFRAVAGLPTLVFFRNGSASEEGIVYLTSERSALSGDFPQDTRAIEVERSTGRIRCFSYKSGSWAEQC